MTQATLVIIPTYNESESLPPLIDRLRAAVPQADVLIVDDASPDGTGDWADARGEIDSHIHALHREGKQGLGTAYLQGFAWGLERGYEVLCEMDADASHRPEQLPLLLAAIEEGAELAIGSRWVRGGEVVNWPKRREVLSRGGNLYITIMLNLHVKDATAGFRAYRAELLRRIDFDSVESKGFSFQIDMTVHARDVGANIVEVPISFVEREAGVSKMSGNIITEALGKVTRWGLSRRFGKRRRATRMSKDQRPLGPTQA